VQDDAPSPTHRPPQGRPLRVLIHARFSTEEQRQSSIDDQVAACQRFVEANLPKGTKPKDFVIDVIKEPEVSGEIADRPGINQVWAGIEAKRWAVIVTEESSRLYRHHAKAGELFESAVDAGVRVICPSDYIDTLDDDWPDRLSTAIEEGDGALASLAPRLADRERELAMVRAKREEVREQAGRKGKLPSDAKLLEHLEAVKGQLLGDEARATRPVRRRCSSGRCSSTRSPSLIWCGTPG